MQTREGRQRRVQDAGQFVSGSERFVLKVSAADYAVADLPRMMS